MPSRLAAAGSGGRTARFACTQCQKGFTSHKGLMDHHTMNVCTRRPLREAEATAGVPAPSSTASSAAAPAVVVNEAAPAAGLAAPATAARSSVRLRSQQAKK